MTMNPGRFINTPLAMRAADAEKLVVMLEEQRAFVMDDVAASPSSRPYDVVAGIAVIPVQGVLTNTKWSWIGATYRGIRMSFQTALVDSEVKAIAMHIDSPGGEVAGCFDLAEDIYAARGAKPIWSIVDESAYSAAYALACAGDVISVPRTGGTGSIGVVAMHTDLTKMLDEQGVKITMVQFGARKTEQYPTAKLSDEARERMQAEVDQLGEMFVGMVARNRKISAGRVRNTEAGTFLGAAGVDAGLADAVASPQEAFAALLKVIS
jgi:capsid assembly protease